jgi:hypothetical protein
MKFCLEISYDLFFWITYQGFRRVQSRKSVQYCSVGDHRPVDHDRIRSRPKNLKTGRDPEKNNGRDPLSVATRDRSRPVIGRDPENFSGRDLEIFLKIYQDIQLDKTNLKFSIGLPKKFQPGRLIPVATVFGSRSDSFVGSRPILGRDPEKSLGRDLDRVEVPNTTVLEILIKTQKMVQNRHF